ncbi:hypothetical protein LTR09_012549 [Extremus antarcticus]|uniref:Uncharacterized protein n=1 Tax=Extremus antarcticus TaxID=702011 RepID=A0AAJ0D4K7_9PEZI|nr:hypothetical protein LTR09_012549 [Extremus antarcticus]
MATFFARYPSFGHEPLQSSSTEFYRMCDFFGWERDDDERRYAHDGFKTALVRQFNAIYGTDASDIKSWILKGKFVNLVDLIDRHNSGGEVIQFSTLQELQDYTIANGKFFPKQSAYAGGILKFLLRDILG